MLESGGGRSYKGGSSSKWQKENVKPDVASVHSSDTLWKERQLVNYRRANNLCFYCVEQFS